MDIEWMKLDPRAQAPRNAYGDDAGWDLFALEETVIDQGASLTWIRTGIAVAIPVGHYGRIVARSSATSMGLLVFEGVIDCGYRDELMGRALCLGYRRVVIPAGESVVQLVVSPIPMVQFREVMALPESRRGKNGFGSSDRQTTGGDT